MKFTNLEKEIFSELLDWFIQDLYNNSCNDHPIKATADNKKQLQKFINDYTSDEDERADLKSELEKNGTVQFLDFQLVEYLKDKING